ncbi:hypothetical protein Nmel_004035 [Mimus melanotis]
MRDLTAQVTSSLLQFPEVTVEALGEAETTLDSVLCGKFSGVMELILPMNLKEQVLNSSVKQHLLNSFWDQQTKSGVQYREFLLVHHLQRANYIPALQLNQSMKTSLMNDHDPHLRERAVARNSLLDQYIKILPTVQRKLAVERAKPYRLPSSVLREVPRPKPLSTATRQANAGNVHVRTSFINKMLSRFKEAWLGNKKTNFSEYNKLLDLVVHPAPSRSVAQDESQQSPCRASTSLVASSPLRSNTHRSSSQKNLPRASELNLPETPLVVKSLSHSFEKYTCFYRMEQRNSKKNLSVVMTEALSIGDPKLYFTLSEAE